MTVGNAKAPKKNWTKPELKTIRAGSAENGPNALFDGPIQNS